MSDLGGIDLSHDPAGRATAFATGCTATWIFVRNLVMRPAIKSCHQQIADLRERLDEYRDQLDRKDLRIGQLEAVLLNSGGPQLRAAMQVALSETRVELDKMGGKL